MRLLLVAALVCFIIALAISIGAGPVLSAGAVTWAIGGFVAWVLAQLVGPYVDAAMHRPTG